MRMPRDLDPERLIRALGVLGYRKTRQTGSHIRITTELGGQHHEIIPKHDFIKIGTLSSILSSIARHHGLTTEQLLARLGL